MGWDGGIWRRGKGGGLGFFLVGGLVVEREVNGEERKAGDLVVGFGGREGGDESICWGV